MKQDVYGFAQLMLILTWVELIALDFAYQGKIPPRPSPWSDDGKRMMHLSFNLDVYGLYPSNICRKCLFHDYQRQRDKVIA